MTLKNREVFVRDPAVARLMNNGQARLDEQQTLREELSNFVCEGQYASGLLRILESYLRHVSGTSQPAGWVSGFYGSGKSHFLKMLVHLWVNTEFPEDGAKARSLVPSLPREIEATLRELDIQAKRCGGLRAAWGSLPTGGGTAVRLTVLGTVLRAMDLPEGYPQARFCLYLRSNGFLDKVKSQVERKGKIFARELNNLYVSPDLHEALIALDPLYRDKAQVRDLLRANFPVKEDISTRELLEFLRQVLESDGRVPCALIALDEVQLYIGDSSDRATQVVEVAEALSKQLDGRVLLVGAGQSAISGTPQLTKLRDRFTTPVELGDADVEAVTRRVLLQKRPQAEEEVRRCLESSSGEIDRQLAGSRLGPRPEDRAVLVDDYPLLPTRRRFWEAVLRAVDPVGAHSQLRTQLRIIFEALRSHAEAPLGIVVPADFLFDQIQADLPQRGVLLRELGETIQKLDDKTERGHLAKRVCGLIFLLRRLPRDGGADLGLRATAPTLADLLVSDLERDGAPLRKLVPQVLQELAEKGVLLEIEGEYNLQTRESAEWDKELRARLSRFANRDHDVHAERQTLLQSVVEKALASIKLQQGESKEARRLDVYFGEDEPKPSREEVQVWVRDGWSTAEKDLVEAARSAGSESPQLFVFLPKAHADDLRQRLIACLATKETLDQKGTPTSDAGKEAHDAMKTRLASEHRSRDALLAELVSGAKVFKGGGVEVLGASLEEKMHEATLGALGRLFPRFRDGDHKSWRVAMERARKGDDSPLQAVGWNGTLEAHPVVAEVLHAIGGGREGRWLRENFRKDPFGWPQDALDGALIALHAAGRLEARHKGLVLPSGQLDQGKISSTEFRSETVVLTTQDKLRLRKLFQSADVATNASDDLALKAGEYLRCLADLVESAGGEPPMPAKPSRELIDRLRSVAGQEQLAQILAEGGKLEALRTAAEAAAALASRRLPSWQLLEDLLSQAAGLPETSDLQARADAVRAGRQLLDANDRVNPILKATAQILRAAVKAAHDSWRAAHDEGRRHLESDPSWQRLTEADRGAILQQEGLAELAAPRVGSDEELREALRATTLSAWRERTDALPRRFANAALCAARMLEPKTQQVRLERATLRTAEEVKAWVTRTEAELLTRLRDGPIVLG